jgi:RNA polymerase sigma-70 factor (ECF subfamily)
MRAGKERERQDERVLVHGAQRGDREAFRALVERYQERAFHIANEVLRSEADAEDVVQEAFAKAYISLAKFEFQSSFYTWLYRIVVNLAIDERRRRKRRGGDKVEFTEETLNSQSADASELMSRIERPDERALRAEQAHAIRAGMDQLSYEHRTVIQLREMDSLSYEEIAEVTGVSRGTVMSRLHYARKRLQESLQGYLKDGKILLGTMVLPGVDVASGGVDQVKVQPIEGQTGKAEVVELAAMKKLKR